MGASARARTGWRLGIAAAVALLGVAALGPAADAQQIVAPGGSQRDCQTVRTCNFSRTAAVRGCLSSYTCRTCKPVRSRCDIGGARMCERMVCSWGG